MKKPRKPKPRKKQKAPQQSPPMQSRATPQASSQQAFEPTIPRRKLTIVRFLEIMAILAGLIGFGYLIFDLFYQSLPDIEISPSETGAPFSLPFSVKTQSILFDMHRTTFECSFDMKTEDGTTFQNITVRLSNELEINRRNPGNYRCSVSLPPVGGIRSLNARISTRYCTNLFGLHCWERTPEPTAFTWVRTGAAGFWVKGKLVY